MKTSPLDVRLNTCRPDIHTATFRDPGIVSRECNLTRQKASSDTDQLGRLDVGVVASPYHRLWSTKPCGNAERVRHLEFILPHKTELPLLHMGVVRRTGCDASQLTHIATCWCRKDLCVSERSRPAQDRMTFDHDKKEPKRNPSGQLFRINDGSGSTHRNWGG